MIKAMLDEALLQQGLRYLAHNPEKNLPNLLKWGERVAREPQHKEYARNWRRLMEDENNNWRRLIVRLLKETAPNVRRRLAVNFFIHAGVLAPENRRRAEEQYGVRIPWAILIDPTGRCNLRCRGCWAGAYDHSQDMGLETVDRVITEAEELGIHFIVMSGGEPTVVMDDLFYLAEKHNKSVFHIYTNGTLIDERAAARFAELGNVTFAVSIEGPEEVTDARRGKGTYRRIMRGIEAMREHGLVYGFSTTYTRENAHLVATDEFIDGMIDLGFAFGWLFTYVPVGADPDLDYMATPEQRKMVYEAVQRWRSEKPIFVADFWNDGEFVGGCIAGGRHYLHINARGDVEPCAFVHFANVNIKDTTLVEALKSPIFRAYEKYQPFCHNHLRPCPIIDCPEMLVKVVEESGAYSTQGDGVTAHQMCQALLGYSQEWAQVADAVWTEKHPDYVSNGEPEPDGVRNGANGASEGNLVLVAHRSGATKDADREVGCRTNR